MKKKLLVLLLLSCISSAVFAQRATVSVDLAKTALLIPNFNVDILLTKRLTLNIETVINPFEQTYCNLYTKQSTLTTELRYWFKRPSYSHFVGASIMGSRYNVGTDADRYTGSGVVLGVVYGYSLYISKRWTLTPTVGVGYGYFNNTTINDGVLSTIDEKLWRPVITKFGIYLTYIIN